ncbi:hypothetical protein HXX76_015226 [Chlamydomonas incerta]|uniref:Uncharacterized protein n=1 Tax=Chlamydomonas incerta TaxID=51695 RepID=A0A835SHM2_CHLIN|nr:hypothetical protein HXX76_015226 [Chlamydomonas incerta]|eukprot:KAG2423588.1 hypothetical protein HXX76_015226 [Chlamydomonas incerta]
MSMVDSDGNRALDATCHWKRLNIDLIKQIAAALHPNEVATGLKLADVDTAAALRDSYKTIYLAQPHNSLWEDAEKPHRAQQPWPGPAFVAHWGRPQPWRALTLPQRRRLLCLAASSGHAGSLEAGGHIDILASLQQAHGYQPSLEDVHAASAAGQVDFLEQLLPPPPQEPGCGPPGGAAAAGAVAAAAAARPQQQPAAGRGNGGGGERAAGKGNGPRPWRAELQAELHRSRTARCDLLECVAEGCPLDALKRHHPYLCHGRGRPPRPAASDQARVEAEAEARAEVGADAEARADAETEADVDDMDGEDVARHAQLLLASAACSPTPCWAAKPAAGWSAEAEPADLAVALGGHADALAFLWDELGWPGPGGAAADHHTDQADHAVPANHADHHADHHASAASAARAASAVSAAADFGSRFLAGCGAHRQATAHALRHRLVEVLRLLAARRVRCLTPHHAVLAARCRSPDALLSHILLSEGVDASEGGEQGEGPRRDGDAWSTAFRFAAQNGASLAVLRALRQRRGAAVDLAAVACGGSEEALDWAAAELAAEGGGLQVLGKQDAQRVERAGNTAALAWLHSRGLLPPPPHPPTQGS